MADHKPTIDERLSRLTERHEALTQSVEMLTISQTKTEKMIAEMVESVTSLARIAHAHENRITHLEDQV